MELLKTKSQIQYMLGKKTVVLYMCVRVEQWMYGGERAEARTEENWVGGGPKEEQINKMNNNLYNFD
jgi:hypothetical protein